MINTASITMQKVSRLFLLCLMLSLAGVWLGFSQPVMAHVLETDGSIGAVLHVDPNDNPVTNQPATFFLEFKDRQGKFQPADCSCQASLYNGSTQIYTGSLFAASQTTSLSSPSFSYTFSQPGVYQLVVQGQPLSPGGFQPFKLKYDIRVSGAGTALSSSWLSWLHHGIFVIGGLIVAGIVAYDIWRRRKRVKVKSI